ncbi:YqeB family protein [Catellatospora methionotrophica]|uniref:YqeB family protein n=1 Tax=Catellatospora methionotrophica TaxID=121620 RepID=UPI0033E3319F
MSTTRVTALWISCVAVGAGLGWLLRAVSEWAASVDGMPLRDWITVLAKVPDPYGTPLCLLLGVAFGAEVARRTLKDSVAVSVTPERVLWRAGRQTRRIARAQISAVYLDGVDDLVFLGTDTGELARANNNLNEDAVKEVFLRHGYPFFDADPHLEQYMRWVEDLPALSATANALLKARQKALEDSAVEDAAELRADLVKLGVVVRQNDDRQFYRLVARAAVADAPIPADQVPA